MNTAIIEKIRKLRALQQSGNVNEAAAAARAAERLIQDHNLSEAELSAPEPDVYTRDEIDTYGASFASWKSILCKTLTTAYQCEGITSYGKLLVYGRAQDVEMVKFQYAWYTLEIERLVMRHAKGRGRAYANSFRRGAVAAINAALKSAAAESRAAVASSAIVLVDSRAIKAREAMQAQHEKTRGRTSAGPSDANGYHAGKQAGAGLSQRTAIGAGGARLLGA